MMTGMKRIQDWRLWTLLLLLVLGGLLAWWQFERYQYDFVEQGRQSLIAQGFRRDDLHVSSVAITRSMWGDDQATIMFRIGTAPNADIKTVAIRRTPFWTAIVAPK